MDNVISSVCSVVATVVLVVVGCMFVDSLRSASSACDESTQVVKTVNNEFKPNGRIDTILNNLVTSTRNVVVTTQNAANATKQIVSLGAEKAVYICARGVAGKELPETTQKNN